MAVDVEKVTKLMRFCPSFSELECRDALEKCSDEIDSSIRHLDSIGIAKFEKEFGLSRSTSRDMYMALAGNLDEARVHLSAWKKSDAQEKRKEQKWLALSPKERAAKLIKPSRLDRLDRYDLVELGLLDEGGGRWSTNAAEWAQLNPVDRQLEWLYTALLLLDTDHAQGFWDLAKDRQEEAVRALEDAGWSEVALLLREAVRTGKPAKLSDFPDRYPTQELTKRLCQWILDHADGLTYFTVYHG